MMFVGPAHHKRLRSGGLPYLVRLLRDEVEQDVLDAALASQLLPPSEDLSQMEDDWRALLDARFRLVTGELHDEWGIVTERT